MGKNFTKTFRAFAPILGDLIWWVIIVVSLCFNYFDPFNLNSRFEDWINQIFYIALSIITSFFVVLIFKPILEMVAKYFGFDEYLGTSPNIKTVRVYSDQRDMLHRSESQFTAGTIITGSSSALLDTKNQWDTTSYCFAHVEFENQRKKWSPYTQTAYQVTANIRLLDENGKGLVDDFIGRWGNQTDQPGISSVINSSYYTSINMVANGRNKYELNIAMKHRSAQFFVAFNNESYYAPSNNLMLANRTVGRTKAIVEVVLEADNIDEKLKFYFELLNMGIGNGLEIKQISEIQK